MTRCSASVETFLIACEAEVRASAVNGFVQFFLLFLVHAYSGQVIDKHSKPRPKLIMDGPWHWLWPCLIPWILLQIPTSIGWLHPIAQGQYKFSKLHLQTICVFLGM